MWNGSKKNERTNPAQIKAIARVLKKPISGLEPSSLALDILLDY